MEKELLNYNLLDELEKMYYSSLYTSDIDIKSFIKNLLIDIKNILNNLYREKIVDMDVEMKVFQSMLEADGLNENELALKNRAKERNE